MLGTADWESTLLWLGAAQRHTRTGGNRHCKNTWVLARNLLSGNRIAAQGSMAG